MATTPANSGEASPGLAGFFERLMGFTRLLNMDRRGCGLSDPRSEAMSLEDEARDVLAVLDAAGSERAVLMGYTTGGLLAIATAALAPERVQAIVLYASMARTLANDDVDWTFDEDGRRAMWAQLAEVWGTGANVEQLAPSRAGEPRMKAWLARMERLSSSPGELLRLMNATGDHDITHLLGELRVPTLILHRIGDRLIDVRHSRYLAKRIPGARYVELEGVDNLPGAVDSSDMLGEIEEFLTGGRSRTVARELLTVIFSDIVGSTGHAARLGDAPWRDLLGAHQTAVRREIERFGGREVKTIGDAFLIAFDGASSQPCAARRRSWAPCAPWASTSASACTPASARSWAAMSAGWPCTSPLASPHSRRPGRCWPPGRRTGPSSGPA
jgi:pimeloyl-ACP methyl ester carboxylesterase